MKLVQFHNFLCWDNKSVKFRSQLTFPPYLLSGKKCFHIKRGRKTHFTIFPSICFSQSKVATPDSSCSEANRITEFITISKIAKQDSAKLLPTNDFPILHLKLVSDRLKIAQKITFGAKNCNALAHIC